MRIAITSRIFEPEPSAASFRLGALARELASSGHEVTILTVKPPPDAPSHDSELPFRVRRFPVLRDKSGYVRGYIQYLSFDLPLFLRLLMSRRFDLIVTEPPPTTGFMVRVASALKRVPYAYYAADIWSDAASQTGAPGWMVRAVRRLETFALKGASVVLSVSNGVSRRLGELGIAPHISTVGNGIDTGAFPYEGPARALQGPTFVYAGTASEWHGASIFIDAYSLVLQTHPDARLVFIGGGSEREQLAEHARELSAPITLLDTLPPNQLAEWLRASTASLASVRPGAGYDFAFPTKLYSSVAAGAPVIFTGVGPGHEFVSQSVSGEPLGISCEYNVAEVAEAMRHLLIHPPPARRRREVSAWAHLHVSIESVAKTIRAEITGALP